MKLVIIKIGVLLIASFSLLSFTKAEELPKVEYSIHDLIFGKLAKTWDEGMPLGNGNIGVLVWQKGENLRLSLDRADLWDLRPMENLNTDKFKYSWVYEQWKNDNYKEVQKAFDEPYNKLPAPSKIPGAGLEFDTKGFGQVISNKLAIKNAICEVRWDSGVELKSFVHATENQGWFQFEGVPKGFQPILIPPNYVLDEQVASDSPVTGQDLRRLNYPEGKLDKADNSITYLQEGWGGFKYKVDVKWQQKGKELTGYWTIHSYYPNVETKPEIDRGSIDFAKAYQSHTVWWKDFWSKSAISIPDKVIEKQWYLEQYKFGSVARDGTPPISLQAVWTADNGKLPPWKGDFHHDLNTQLSYWPAYSGNHLDLEMGFLNWLEKHKTNFKKYTKTYYDNDGLAVPGVSTLTGEPMGGWIQYAFGPTVSAWLGQHFYLHWQFSQDRVFLKEQAYPWIRDVCIHLESISVKNDAGKRQLPISASPELHNNDKEAWWGETTNFDLALIRFSFSKAAELATELGMINEAKEWVNKLAEWPQLSVDPEKGLMIAPGANYDASHRHFSHLVGIHPLGIIDQSHGKTEQKIVENTVKNLEDRGSSYYTGYSFSWLANLQARNFDGEAAATSLKVFAENFCLPNSFHVNGEQHDRGFSNFKYRPFTLEGNFAFAAGLQEMLIQSHTGVIHICPAIPADWTDLSFSTLRTVGAFLVSVKKKDGNIKKVKVEAENGGLLKLKNPFGDLEFICSQEYNKKDGVIEVMTKAGDKVFLKTKKD